MVDVLTPDQRRRCMGRVKNKNTSIELLLRKALWSSGLRYRLKSKLIGKPDIVFNLAKVAIFVDGCFWHGCPEHGQLPQTNESFWESKIRANVDRDRVVSKALTGQGWIVIRFWEHDIKRDIKGCVSRVKMSIQK